MKIQVILFFLLLSFNSLYSQTIYWNALLTNNHPNPDSLYYGDYSLEATALELASFLNEASGGNSYSTQFYYGSIPNSGIVLNIDSTMENNFRLQYCNLISNESDQLIFKASTSHGVRFGVYAFLEELGFRFYAPGDLWTIIPSLGNPFSFQSKIYKTTREVHSFFGQGGSGSVPVLDPDGTLIKSQWDAYHLRNNMLDEYDMTGHEAEEWVAKNQALLLANPCYLAEFNESHDPISGAMPSIFEPQAMESFAEFCAKDPFNFFGNPNYYSKIRNYKSRYKISMEAADGAKWGNTTTSCGVSSWPSESDQQFTNVNFGASYLESVLNYDFRITAYAYYQHSVVPSFSLHPKVQIGIASAFQRHSTINGQLYNWHNFNSNIFEYDYLNLPTGSWQAPYFSADYMSNQANRINQWNTLGALYETSNSIFSSSLYLHAFHKSIMDSSDFKSNFNTLLLDLFPQSYEKIRSLYDHWGNFNRTLDGNYLSENPRKYPLYIAIIDSASNLVSEPKEMERVQLLKAYMHYLILMTDAKYCDSAFKDQSVNKLCKFIASTWLTNIITSYQQFNIAISEYYLSPSIRDEWIHTIYNADSTQVLGFELIEQKIIENPPLSSQEIDVLFNEDKSRFPLESKYNFVEARDIISEACNSNLIPKDTINVYINMFSTPSDFTLTAFEAGTFKVIYSILPTSPKKYFTMFLDSYDQLYSDNKTSDSTILNGEIVFTIPKAGEYQLTLVYRGDLEANFSFVSNKNYLYKKTATYSNSTIERYRDSLSAPRYIFVPNNIDRLYFGIDHVYNDPATASKFIFTNPDGQVVPCQITSFDSSQYYIEIDSAYRGKFWQLYADSTIGNLFTLVNTQNVELYLQQGICESANNNVLANEIVNEFLLFPNPNQGLFTIENKMGLAGTKMEIFDLSGKTISAPTILGNITKCEINLSGYSKGIYFISLGNNNGKAASVQKIIIN